MGPLKFGTDLYVLRFMDREPNSSRLNKSMNYRIKLKHETEKHQQLKKYHYCAQSKLSADFSLY